MVKNSISKIFCAPDGAWTQNVITNVNIVFKMLGHFSLIWEIRMISINFDNETRLSFLVNGWYWWIHPWNLCSANICIENKMCTGPKTRIPFFIRILKFEYISIITNGLFCNHFQWKSTQIVFLRIFADIGGISSIEIFLTRFVHILIL